MVYINIGNCSLTYVKSEIPMDISEESDQYTSISRKRLKTQISEEFAIEHFASLKT